MAVSTPLPDSHFEGLDVEEYECRDGLYRYTTNSFRTFQDARKSLMQLRQQGYTDAFVQTREWCERAIR